MVDFDVMDSGFLAEIDAASDDTHKRTAAARRGEVCGAGDATPPPSQDSAARPGPLLLTNAPGPSEKYSPNFPEDRL